jgi:hypothetical protein
VIQRILHAKNFLACILAAATGMVLHFHAPFPDFNPFLRVMAIRSSAAFLFFKYSYTLFLYTGPYIAYSVLFSGVYICALKATRNIRAGQLPLYPDPAERNELSLVIGKLHHARTRMPSETPNWLVIPEPGLFTGIAIVGPVGSGKTAACMYPFAEQILAYSAHDENRRIGGLILEVEGGFCGKVHEILKRRSRAEDPLKKDDPARTKEEIASIKLIYLDLDHGGSEAPVAIENSGVVPTPNYVLSSSPEKYQMVWEVERLNLEEAEILLRAMAREFDGDPADTDATRVLRVPGFANKKYETDFYVRARRESTETYHVGDYKLSMDSQDLLHYNYDNRVKRGSPPRFQLSQSEHDWAFAKRALARGDDPEDIIRRIAQHRATDKSNPEYYARHNVMKAQIDVDGPSCS